jgi:hypothetical protein
MEEDQQPKIEWIGPKTLVIVRMPENHYIDPEGDPFEKQFSDILNDEAFKHFCFIVVRQSNIDQIEFEYPKNYRSLEDRPVAIISHFNADNLEIRKFADEFKNNSHV